MSDLSWTSDGPTGSPNFDAGFHTDWFMVHAAGQLGAGGSEAMAKLCSTYWYPLYAYVRRKGHGPQEAQDLTQEFFARLLATPWLEDVHPSKGKFRAFLLASMNHFLANEWRREQTQKRGGGQVTFSLDAVEAEDRYRIEPAQGQSPDKVFDRDYARTLFERIRVLLQSECFATGKGHVFEELKGMFDGEANQRSYAELGAKLDMTEAALKKAAQRLRERYCDLLRQEVAATVNDPGEVDEEIRNLCAALCA